MLISGLKGLMFFFLLQHFVSCLKSKLFVESLIQGNITSQVCKYGLLL